jgi:aromatic-L-amino-acid/L-tryptophan decarboxylase
MNIEEFRKNGHELIDWIASYYENIEKLPVKPNVEPYQIFNNLTQTPPEKGEAFEDIFSDFNDKILPGMTHWQHPKFFAYFPANTSFPSILGELLTSALGAQCMSWITSPAATELEELVMNWLRDMTGLPKEFSGVIEDTASTSALCSILTARERISDKKINESGFDNTTYRVYCSEEAHSSIEKAVKIAGIGSENLVKINADDDFSMEPESLEEMLKSDIHDGYKPLCVIGTVGTTSTTAVDPIEKIGKICRKYYIWFHLDAAYAGTAMLLEEMRHHLKGIEYVDTFVFNPHKWMFTNFDCSAYFVRDKEALIRTFDILPEYLKTDLDSKVNNYRDWGIQLGRRFRALKLWFVIRHYGTDGLKEKVRMHLEYAKIMKAYIENDPDFEIMSPMLFNLICFRYNPGNITEQELNQINKELLDNINATGKAFLTHTKLKGRFTLRFVASNTHLEERHIHEAWELIKAESLKKLL